MIAPPRFDGDLARKTLPEGSSFWNLRLILPLMLAQSLSLCFIIAAHSALECPQLVSLDLEMASA
jgi:hypothetical protein